MAKVIPFARAETAFDPEVAAVLGAAYDRAIAGLHDSGQPQIVREIIAKRIVALAARGERDPQLLSEAALAGLGVPR